MFLFLSGTWYASATGTVELSMNEFTNLRERLPAILKALAVGIPAGYLFDSLDTPIPWMIGPMIAVATLNLMGVRMYAVPYGRQMGQVILGSAVSLYFTPTVVAALSTHFVAITAATASAFLIGGLGALILSRVSGVDGKSAFFASIPGGAMAMAVLAERYGAQIAPVAVAHSLRVSIVVIVVPFVLTYGGIPFEGAAYRPAVPLDLAVLVPWLAFGLPIATMIIATAPGGFAEMTITAQALQIGVPLVVAFHLFRVVVVNMGSQYIYAFATWALGRSPD